MKYSEYDSYKDNSENWLGKLPSHWEKFSIKRKFKIINGSTPKSGESEYWDGELLWVTPADFAKQEKGYLSNSDRQITQAGLESCGTRLVDEDSIILSTRAPIGEVVQAGKELCTNQGCKSLAVDAPEIYERFYYYSLKVSSEQLNILGLGTTFMELSKDALGYYPVAFPPIEEQQKIVAFLDYKTQQIDQLIEKKKALIEKLEEKRIAVITQAVTKGLDKNVKLKPSGVDWLGDVPEHWELRRLRFLLSMNLTNGLFKKAEFWGKGKPIVNVFDAYIHGDIINEISLDRVECNEEEYEKYSALDGDFFFVRSSLKLEGVGKSATILSPNEEVVFECHLVRGRPDKSVIDPKYLNLYLNSKYAREYFVSVANVVTMATIDQMKLKNLILAIPDINEQKDIVSSVENVLSEIDGLCNKASVTIDKLNEYRSSLITSAVTGKIDVRAVQIPKEVA